MHLDHLIKTYSKKSSNIINVKSIDSPIGQIIVAANREHVLLVMCQDSKNIGKRFEVLADELNCTFVEEKTNVLNKLENELKEYFEGKLKKFNVPLQMNGSEFQKEVWKKLMDIEYGSTLSYGDLARNIGRPASHSRAVGEACGANAHLIVIPCHRLVASKTKGGFSCGINRKDWLLDHEEKNTNKTKHQLNI